MLAAHAQVGAGVEVRTRLRPSDESLVLVDLLHRESTGSRDLGEHCLVRECQSLIQEELGKIPGLAKIVRGRALARR